MPKILKQTEIAMRFLMATRSVDDCTLKTSYRDFDEIYFYQDIRENQERKFKTKDYWKSVFNAKDPASNAIEAEKKEVKQTRAQGGCLGTKSRRKT